MGKLTKIDLNDFDLIKSKDDLGESNGYLIFPVKYPDGTQPPPMIWARKGNTFITITDIDNAVWFKDCRISITGSDAEYAKRVDWWISSALADDEWKEIVNNTYNKHGFRVSDSLNKAIMWLKTRMPSARKSYLNKFLNNWFTKGVHMAIQSKNRGAS
jgi:hypothetical protein